jgi:hypothetical protein
MMMTIRGLFSLAVLALVGFLSLVLVDHLWSRYSEETEARGLAGSDVRHPASQAASPSDPSTYSGSADAGRARESSVGAEAISE